MGRKRDVLGLVMYVSFLCVFLFLSAYFDWFKSFFESDLR